MTVRGAASSSPFALGAEDRARLGERVDAALRRARRERGRIVASVDVAVDASLDLDAAVLASRDAGRDRFFCFEQPDRGGFALATLGTAAIASASGRDRFAAVAAECRALNRGALADEIGPRWVGGFAFAPDGGAAPSGGRSRRRNWCCRSGPVAAGRLGADDADRGRRRRRVGRRRGRAPGGPRRVAARRPDAAARPAPCRARPRGLGGAAEHFEAAITRATERIKAGDLHKVVLAREVRVHAPEAVDPSPVYDGLRTVFPSCYCYLVGTPELAFVGASPELLVRRDGARADGRARRHAAPQRRPVGRPLPGRAAPVVAQGPRGTGDRHPPHRAGPGPGVGVGGRRRASRSEGPQRAAPGHADTRPADRSAAVRRAGRAAARRPPWAASRRTRRCR